MQALTSFLVSLRIADFLFSLEWLDAIIPAILILITCSTVHEDCKRTVNRGTKAKSSGDSHTDNKH